MVEKRYNRYTKNRPAEILNSLRYLKEDGIVDKVQEVEMSTSGISSHEAFVELTDIIKKAVPETVGKVYAEPIVERGDILVIEYKGQTFELVPK